MFLNCASVILTKAIKDKEYDWESKLDLLFNKHMISRIDRDIYFKIFRIVLIINEVISTNKIVKIDDFNELYTIYEYVVEDTIQLLGSKPRIRQYRKIGIIPPNPQSINSYYTKTMNIVGKLV